MERGLVVRSKHNKSVTWEQKQLELKPVYPYLIRERQASSKTYMHENQSDKTRTTIWLAEHKHRDRKNAIFNTTWKQHKVAELNKWKP